MRRRREDKTQPGPQPGAGHQAAAQAIGDAFGEHDLRCLRNLTPAELAAQADARRALHSYVMAVWEQPKHPAGCWAPWEQSHRPPCRCHEDSDVDPGGVRRGQRGPLSMAQPRRPVRQRG